MNIKNMINDLQGKDAEPSLELRDSEGRDVFRIGSKGEVYWHKPGEDILTRAETDNDLGQAMALAILQIAGMDYVRLIEVYLGESTTAFRQLLIKKIMETSIKSKTLKKEELVKIIEEFKI